MARTLPSLIGERLGWPPRITLTARILFVNIIALGLLAGSLFYLDSYRNELLGERFRLAREEVQITAKGLEKASREGRVDLLTQIGIAQHLRLRLYDAEGQLVADSFELAPPSFVLTDPDGEPWYQHAARILDRGMDFLLGAPPIPDYEEPAEPGAMAWPEISQAIQTEETVIRNRLAPDRTPVITAATPIGPDGAVLMTTRNARDITQNVRNARQTLAIIVGAALVVSILLSLFLARTIVQPLRELVRAAVRVRLGRDREVVVPRLPDRRDELGLLARAISDMTAALRQRIDAVESFAADVAHEVKNPLTSLRSALESLEKVEDPALRQQLMDIAMQDVERVDWLVTEIADASRIDAQLSRTVFEPVDMLKIVTALTEERDRRGVNGSCQIDIRGVGQDLRVAGDAPRLERVLHNLLDNAVSFSPDQGRIEIEMTREGSLVTIAMSDHGVGIPRGSHERIFERFHSLRPEDEGFGKHSGLG
ncbi:MAG: stimulus-sensing domain-containing protein, partial [Novosphingobium sp.]|nr:stimulus-sensing domain-containing protein [Novosphingobium sp.]